MFKLMFIVIKESKYSAVHFAGTILYHCVFVNRIIAYVFTFNKRAKISCDISTFNLPGKIFFSGRASSPFVEAFLRLLVVATPRLAIPPKCCSGWTGQHLKLKC